MNLCLENVNFAYPANPEKNILSEINLSIKKGELLGIIGKTGAGKSTLLQLCAGLLYPTEGAVEIDKRKLFGQKDWKNYRKKIGLVFQFPEKQLFEETVFKDVAFGLQRSNGKAENLKELVYQSLEKVGMSPDIYAQRSPHQLSNGEQRKIAIAGIIASDPEILFLDEPTMGLDYRSSSEIEKLVRNLHDRDKTVCVVSHNLDFVARISNRIIVLDRGKIIYDGSSDDLFYNDIKLKELSLGKPEIVSICEEVSKLTDIKIQGVFSINDLIELLNNRNFS
ncbi:ATP-binding cassette domain-containing protein [candidate division KSB1 bacterium]